jgi:predicted phage tail protein
MAPSAQRNGAATQRGYFLDLLSSTRYGLGEHLDTAQLDKFVILCG